MCTCTDETLLLTSPPSVLVSSPTFVVPAEPSAGVVGGLVATLGSYSALFGPSSTDALHDANATLTIYLSLRTSFSPLASQ